MLCLRVGHHATHYSDFKVNFHFTLANLNWEAWNSSKLCLTNWNITLLALWLYCCLRILNSWMLTPEATESWCGSDSHRPLTTEVWVLSRTVRARFIGDNTILAQFFLPILRSSYFVSIITYSAKCF